MAREKTKVEIRPNWYYVCLNDKCLCAQFTKGKVYQAAKSHVINDNVGHPWCVEPKMFRKATKDEVKIAKNNNGMLPKYLWSRLGIPEATEFLM